MEIDCGTSLFFLGLGSPPGGYSHTLPIRVCAAQRGRDFEAPDLTGYSFQRRFLERGIIFRTHESSSFVSSHSKLFKERLLLKIRFNALTSRLLYSCCNLCFSVQAGVFWRELRGLTLPSWINRHAEVWNESIMYPREMETGSKERDGGGEVKSLAYECGSFLERGISFRAISRTGYKKLANF